MKPREKKRAFTLTELLVVVLIIGVLSAVALPKFNRVIETRRTGEAEELLTAVRAEQEKRCSLDKKYAMTFTQLGDIVAKDSTDNFNYALTAKGANASSKGKAYSLQIPSYRDGRLCCEGDYCEKLNKNYPPCATLTDLKAETVCEATAPAAPDPMSCSGAANRSCGCKNGGTQTRTCDTSVGSWGAWGTCSISDACDCTTVSGPMPVSTSQDCNTCGTQSTSYACDSSTGKWIESMGACSVNDSSECAQDCPTGKTWDGSACVCADQAAKDSCVDKDELLVFYEGGATGKLQTINVHYTWDDESCSCSCPTEGNELKCGVVADGPMMMKFVDWDPNTCTCKKPDVAPVQPYYFKCVTRVVSSGGGLISQGTYSTMDAARSACLSEKNRDTSASFMKYLSGGGPIPGCSPLAGQSCALTPSIYIKWQCSTEPPRPAAGYGFDEILCVVVQPHE